MKRSTKLILLLFVVTALLAGIFVIIRYLPGGEDEPSATVPSADRYVLYQEKMENVTRVSFKHRDHEQCDFVKKDGKWVGENDADFKVDSTYLENLLGYLLTITSDKKVTGDSDFGFNDPQFRIEIDGAEKNVLTFGTTNALGDKTYFRLNDGDIYLVDRTIWAGFNVSILNFAYQDEIPQYDTYYYLGIDVPGFSKEFSYNRNRWVIRDTLDETYDVRVAKIVSNYEALYWGGTVAFKPDEATLQEMGFGEDSVVRLTFMTPMNGGIGLDEGKTLKHVLEIGNEIPDSTYVYARYPGSPFIGKVFYQIRKNALLLNEE